uniref:Protein kinase domain-containing protein n=1 Tax=Acrobeloides nanus TaxID=290746 RepID=A0A914DRB0_9BILA
MKELFAESANRTNTIVAIKEIKKEPEDEESLKREEQILKELSEIRHENLVWLIKSVDTQDHLYLIMEYCNFGDLDEYLYHRRRLDTDTLQHFFKQIAQALYVMTQLDIIHRDLKPQSSNWSLNILKNFYIEDGDLNLQVPLGTSKRLQELLYNLLVVDQKKRMDIYCFLTHPFFESDLITMIVQSPRSHRSPNTTFEDLDIGNSLLPLLLRVNEPSAPLDDDDEKGNSLLPLLLRANEPSAPLDDDDENDKTLIAPRQVQIEDEKVLFVTITERPKDNEKIGETVKFRQEKKENEKAYQNLNIDEQIKSLPYFYEKMTRNECEQELNKRGNNGDFLLRESESRPGVYSLSVKYQPRNLHFTISKCEDESGKLLSDDNKFDSMNELVECYTKMGIYQLPGTHEQLFLRKPLLMIPEISHHNDEHT